MSRIHSPVARSAGALLAAVALVGGLAACAPETEKAASTTENGVTTTSVTIGAASNGVAEETTLDVEQVDAIREALPKDVLDSGKLVIGVGDLPAGFPPLAYTGDDGSTETGSEPDLGRLVAAVFGLEPDIKKSTWENLFVGIDSGETDLGFSNITDTEERKLKYDFASYRQDNLGWEVLESSDWNFDGDYETLDGLTVSVSAGTNQEKILLEWKSKLESEGKALEVKYYADTNSVYLALNSGKIDAYFGPNPGIAYHGAQTAGTANPTRGAGVFSGAGETLQGLIAATTKKDSGLAEPTADAINYLIENGQYAKWLDVWNLATESVDTSEVNPAGLPITNE
jgi:polar amino acid transport system substrate-binding protein